MTAKIEFTDADWRELNALLQFKVTLEHVCDYTGFSRDTVIRRIKEKHGMTFKEYADLKRQRTATKLQQKAVEMAINGNATMMIFCLKNMASWSDKIDQTLSGDKIEVKLVKASECKSDS